jgi:hypothetical protein
MDSTWSSDSSASSTEVRLPPPFFPVWMFLTGRDFLGKGVVVEQEMSLVDKNGTEYARQFVRVLPSYPSRNNI